MWLEWADCPIETGRTIEVGEVKRKIESGEGKSEAWQTNQTGRLSLCIAAVNDRVVFFPLSRTSEVEVMEGSFAGNEYGNLTRRADGCSAFDRRPDKGSKRRRLIQPAAAAADGGPLQSNTTQQTHDCSLHIATPSACSSYLCSVW